VADGRHIRNLKNRDISATVQLIATICCVSRRILAINRAECWNLLILQFQDGGPPPYWKWKFCNISSIVQTIETKFYINRYILAINRAECWNLPIWQIVISSRSVKWLRRYCEYSISNMAATNYCTDTQIVAINLVKSRHLHIFKIYDGGLPPYWKSKILHNLQHAVCGCIPCVKLITAEFPIFKIENSHYFAICSRRLVVKTWFEHHRQHGSADLL